jgi:hypothetical protein
LAAGRCGGSAIAAAGGQKLSLFHFHGPMKMKQSVSKSRHIKFRSRGITQKKAYNIQNKAKVRNQK